MCPFLTCSTEYPPVDRILQKQKAERQAAEDLARERLQQQRLVSEKTSQPPPLPPGKPATSMEPAPPSPDSSPTLNADRANLASGIRGSLGDFGRRFLGRQRVPGIFPDGHEYEGDGAVSERPAETQTTLPPNDRANGNLPLLPPPRPSPSRPLTPGPHVTPLSNIST